MSMQMRRSVLSRRRTLRLLDNLAASQVVSTTMYFREGSDPAQLEKVIRLVSGLSSAPEGFAASVSNSHTGGAVFWGRDHGYLVIPPFPVTEDMVSSGADVAALHTLVDRERLIGLIIIRLGEYAIGVFKGETMLGSKVGTGLVHARHRQGGSSAHRFERHREKQMESFFTRVCAHAQEQLGPYLRSLDYLVYGGERYTTLSFRSQCQFLKSADDRVLPTLLDIRHPRQAALESAIEKVLSSTVIEWADDPVAAPPQPS
ncbi:MAG: hypothetical protein HYY32_02550 [Chloroflexi bacterium]|nr:hypothetical protein [Chloroflexota bacterium]